MHSNEDDKSARSSTPSLRVDNCCDEENIDEPINDYEQVNDRVYDQNGFMINSTDFIKQERESLLFNPSEKRVESPAPIKFEIDYCQSESQQQIVKKEQQNQNLSSQAAKNVQPNRPV